MNRRTELEQLRTEALARYEQLGHIVEKVVELVDETLADEPPAAPAAPEPETGKHRHRHLTVIKGVFGGAIAGAAVRVVSTRGAAAAAATAIAAAVAVPLAGAPLIFSVPSPAYGVQPRPSAVASAPLVHRPGGAQPSAVPSATRSQHPGAAPQSASAVPLARPSPVTSGSAPQPSVSVSVPVPVPAMPPSPVRSMMGQHPVRHLMHPQAPSSQCTLKVAGICVSL